MIFSSTMPVIIRRRGWIPSLIIAGVALVATGCSNSGSGVADRRTSGGATPQTFRNVSMDSCMDAATIVIRENFGAVRTSATTGTIEGGPQSFTQRGGTARVTDPALKPTYKMRRFGTIWLTQGDGGVIANCQVRVQRLDTTDYRAFRTHDEFNDLPTATPIDSDAGLRADQQEVWTDLPRDSEMERQILGAIYRRLHGLSDDVNAADAPQS
ncbi:MAG: hypothetical protein H6819_00670 [Phycisphaerales bacterium]|nr:hypothetical protein [Phycisphaerales bacterium]MCB9857279.1 hypothetical protein [Phycisphaerales bacterium]MCB9863007.1 hypothetical protein [Phycisphaerales bacterium]